MKELKPLVTVVIYFFKQIFINHQEIYQLHIHSTQQAGESKITCLIITWQGCQANTEMFV